jgi:hypothetical protein
MSILVPIQYTQGVPVTGDIMRWNGRKFVPVSDVYWTQHYWCLEDANSGGGISISPKYYPLGIVYVPAGETVTLESISARTDTANQTMRILKRAFGSTTLVYISPASAFSFLTVSTSGSILTTNLPATLNSEDELFVQFGTNSFNAMSIALNIKHKR